MHHHPGAPLTILTVLAVTLVAHDLGACERCEQAWARRRGAAMPAPAAPRTADPAPPTATASAPGAETTALLRELDARTAIVGAPAPQLSLPARIGLARIENGAITPIPPAEWELWRDLRTRLGPTAGDLVPVTSASSQSITPGALSRTPHDAITHLRLGAARQRLDALLIYEIVVADRLNHTELTVLDATVVGAWILPTHRAHATAHAAATLFDVPTGHAYDSAIGTAEDSRSASILGSQDRRHRQRQRVTRQAVGALTPEIEAMLHRAARRAPPASRDAATHPTNAYTTESITDDGPPAARDDTFWPQEAINRRSASR